MSPRKQNNKELLQYAGLATQLMVAIALALWAGIQIDKRISPTARITTIALPILVIALSLWRLIIQSNKPKK